MSFSKNTPRILGIAFLFQAVASLLSETVSDSLIDPASISNSMINISNNTLTMHVGIVGRLATAIGILLLTILLYTTLKSQNKVIARMGFWVKTNRSSNFCCNWDKRFLTPIHKPRICDNWSFRPLLFCDSWQSIL